MPYTVAQAAKAAGRSKSTLLRAIQAGKMSATRDEASGGWLIEPVELHRVFRAAPAEPVRIDANGSTRVAELEARIAGQDALLAAHRSEIDDLRRQRDREAEE